MQAMVMQAAQMQATYQAGQALARAYLSLRSEMLEILEPDGHVELREECERLFPVFEEPPPYAPAFHEATSAKLSAAANEARLGLLKLQGWIQGLIDEATLHERLRLEAEAKVAQANRPRTGFQKP
jgi:hypothetical protein